MSRTINMWRDPYNQGFSTCRLKTATFESGVTVLVGCNGSGKSTMLHNIQAELENKKIPVFFYDNVEKNRLSLYESLSSGDVKLASMQMCSSEGENISLNLGQMVQKLKNFLKTGKNGKYYQKLKDVVGNERWLLIDAIDSGYSIDNVMELKEFFSMILNDAKKMGLNLYIVVSSNEYELAYNSNCMDVTEGKYVRFNDYSEYKKFILHTRKKKEKRYK